MNNLLSYCGLIDSRMRASEKDLPVYILFTVQLKKDFSAKFCAELLENAAEIPREILSKYSALLSVSLSRKTTFLNSKLFDIESVQCIQGNLI